MGEQVAVHYHFVCVAAVPEMAYHETRDCGEKDIPLDADT